MYTISILVLLTVKKRPINVTIVKKDLRLQPKYFEGLEELSLNH